jgi:2',3'-cyclic-nucleotide 2'-phosphodiesterase/3'-nucleotidase
MRQITPPAPQDRQDSDLVRLRLLQTTDLHMHLLAFDYALMQPTRDRGLANLVSQIEAFRSDGQPTLLFDTGDFLQGTPLADAAFSGSQSEPHPIATAFNTLSYDAIVVGNHDFDYGLAALHDISSQINCPILSANITPTQGHASYLPATLISVETGPQKQPLRVGVIGLTTPVVAVTTDQGTTAVTARDPVSTAKTVIKTLQQQGADIIIALCHFGIDPDDHLENVAADIAGLEEVDAVFAGHTHEIFPTNSLRKNPDIDVENGTIHGTPTVMSGAFGQSLGLIELELKRTDTGYQIVNHTANNLFPDKIADPAIFPEFRDLHDKTVSEMGQTVGQTMLPLSTAFSLVQPDLTQFLLADARRDQLKDMLNASAFAQLPRLSTAAPFLTGSRFDPEDFVAVAPGPILRSDVAAIYPFNNPAVAVLRNGAQIKNWLESSASMFLPITIGLADQPLIDANVPPYRFDTIFGLTYTIDVNAVEGQRIKAIKHNDVLLDDHDKVVLVTTTNRLEQGHNIPPSDVICIANRTSQESLADYVRRNSPIHTPCPFVWDFAPLPNTSARYWTCRDAEVSGSDRDLTDLGVDKDGFRHFRMSFDT